MSYCASIFKSESICLKDKGFPLLKALHREIQEVLIIFPSQFLLAVHLGRNFLLIFRLVARSFFFLISNLHQIFSSLQLKFLCSSLRQSSQVFKTAP